MTLRMAAEHAPNLRQWLKHLQEETLKIPDRKSQIEFILTQTSDFFQSTRHVLVQSSAVLFDNELVGIVLNFDIQIANDLFFVWAFKAGSFENKGPDSPLFWNFTAPQSKDNGKVVFPPVASPLPPTNN